MKYLGAPQSGSQAGTTASHNRAGQYFRNRRTPVSPTRTPKQGVIRTFFGAASSAWQLLDGTLQAAWTSFAANYPVVDSLGQSIVLTGHQYFVGIQTSLQNALQPINTAVPVNTTVNPLAPVTAYVDNSGIVLAFFTAPVNSDFALIAASKVLSGGKNFNKTFSQFAVGLNGPSGVDISTDYVSQFGVPAAARKVFIRAIPVNSSGLSASPIIVQQTSIPAGTLLDGGITSATAGTVAVAGADTTATEAALFQIFPGTTWGCLIATTPLTAGAGTFTGVTSGITVYARVTDGTAYAAATNTVVVT